MRLRNACALFCALLAMPFSVSFGDVESDTLHNNTYQEIPATTQCDMFSCSLFFQATKHNNTAITNINCSFYITAGGQVAVARLYSQNNGALAANVPVYFLGNSGNSFTALGINAQVNLYLKQGDAPVFFLSMYDGVFTNLNCTVSGYHS